MASLVLDFADYVVKSVGNMQANFPTYMVGALGFTFGIHMFQFYLDCRQLKKNYEKTIPKNVQDLVEQKEFDTTQDYNKDKRIASMWKGWIGIIVSTFTAMFLSPYVWIKLDAYENEYTRSIYWMLILHAVERPLQYLFSLHSDFVTEAKHGFNKKTPKLWITDTIKSELIAVVLMSMIPPCIIYLVRWGGETFYLYLWAFTQALVFVFMWIYPTFIAPLFNKFEPLKDEDLKKKIDELAASLKFPLTKLFEVDGSKRSAHSNAYFFGFWKNKRIVLFDTLLKQSHEEILAILCHEMGHWKFNHINFNLVIMSVHFFVLFWSYGQVMYSPIGPQIIADFQFPKDTDSVLVSLMLFSAIISPVEVVIQRFMIILSRTFEFQADTFASIMNRGEDLIAALKVLTKENKGELNPDWLYAWYHYSHPTITERITNIENEEKKKKKGN